MKFLALDTETTGLFPEKDAIIEIAAVVFDLEKTLSTWDTVVTTTKPVSKFILSFTNISQQEIDAGMDSDEAMNKMRTFLDVDYVVGHNIDFDLAFMKAHGLELTIPKLDTYSLAALLLPDEPSYSLQNLSSVYNLSTEGARHHRALADTEATAALFKLLYSRIGMIPKEKLSDILELSKDYTWPGMDMFRHVFDHYDTIASAHEVNVTVRNNTAEVTGESAIEVSGNSQKASNPQQSQKAKKPQSAQNTQASLFDDVTSQSEGATETTQATSPEANPEETLETPREIVPNRLTVHPGKQSDGDSFLLSYDFVCHRDSNIYIQHPQEHIGERLALQYMLRDKPSSQHSLDFEKKGIVHKRIFQADPMTCTAEHCPESSHCAYYKQLTAKKTEGIVSRKTMFELNTGGQIKSDQNIFWEQAETLPDTMFFAGLTYIDLDSFQVCLEKIRNIDAVAHQVDQLSTQLAIFFGKVAVYLQNNFEKNFISINNTMNWPYELKTSFQAIEALSQEVITTLEAASEPSLIHARLQHLSDILGTILKGTLQSTAFLQIIRESIRFGLVAGITMCGKNTYDIPLYLEGNEKLYLESALGESGELVLGKDPLQNRIIHPDVQCSVYNVKQYTGFITKLMHKLLETQQKIVIITSGHKVQEELFGVLKDTMHDDTDVLAIPITTKYAMAHDIMKNTTRKTILCTTMYTGIPEGLKPDVLLITHLPFESPENDWVKIRTEDIEDSFSQYQLPRSVITVLHWIQQVPKETDVYILDNRLIQKNYGKEFIKYMPNFVKNE